MIQPSPQEPSSLAQVFIDSNVLIYAHDASDKDKQSIAKELLAELWDKRLGALSTQVLQEFYVVATTKLDPTMSRPEARELVNEYAEWQLIRIDVVMIVNASKREEQHKISFWDALIIEAAKRAGAETLKTEDLADGTRIDGVLIENPFNSLR